MGDIYRLLAEQHISEYGSRLRHVDELLEHTEKKLAQTPQETEISAQMEQLKQERDRLAAWLDETKRMPLDKWREYLIDKSGPMGMWDAIAQQMEDLVERIEH